MGSLEHANWFMRALFSAVCLVIVVSVVLAQRGRQMFIRRIPGLTAVEEAVGRATEMGRPVFFSPGMSSADATDSSDSLLDKISRRCCSDRDPKLSSSPSSSPVAFR